MKYEEARRILRSLSRKFKAQREFRYAQALALGEKCIKELSQIKARKAGDGARDGKA
jgi:hypothetical protein